MLFAFDVIHGYRTVFPVPLGEAASWDAAAVERAASIAAAEASAAGVNPDVIGIDVGITLLSAENPRGGNVWRWFMRTAEIRRAMRLIKLGD